MTSLKVLDIGASSVKANGIELVERVQDILDKGYALSINAWVIGLTPAQFKVLDSGEYSSFSSSEDVLRDSDSCFIVRVVGTQIVAYLATKSGTVYTDDVDGFNQLLLVSDDLDKLNVENVDVFRSETVVDLPDELIRGKSLHDASRLTDWHYQLMGERGITPVFVLSRQKLFNDVIAWAEVLRSDEETCKDDALESISNLLDEVYRLNNLLEVIAPDLTTQLTSIKSQAKVIQDTLRTK